MLLYRTILTGDICPCALSAQEGHSYDLQGKIAASDFNKAISRSSRAEFMPPNGNIMIIALLLAYEGKREFLSHSCGVTQLVTNDPPRRMFMTFANLD